LFKKSSIPLKIRFIVEIYGRRYRIISAKDPFGKLRTGPFGKLPPALCALPSSLRFAGKVVGHRKGRPLKYSHSPQPLSRRAGMPRKEKTLEVDEGPHADHSPAQILLLSNTLALLPQH
jgi:hypothetical protein